MKKSFLILFLIISSFLLANDLNLSLTGITNFNEFYASYLDPDNIANQPILFTGSIENTTPRNISFYLTLEITWNNTHLLDESDGKINSRIPINANQTWTFTNQDVINNVASGYFNASLDIEDIKNKVANFKNILMETGKFPDGQYVFRFRAYNMNDIQISNVEEYSFEITNYSSITLIQPGLALGTGILDVPNITPIFIWNSNANEYTFKLYHLQSGNSSSNQLDSTTPLYETTCNVTSLRYPTSAPSLENGQIYAWKIEVENSNGTSSNNLISSDYFVFRVNSNTSENGEYQQILTFLQNFGINVPGLQNLLNGGYVPTGQITFNNRTITQDEWNEILNKIISGEITIKSANIE